MILPCLKLTVNRGRTDLEQRGCLRDIALTTGNGGFNGFTFDLGQRFDWFLFADCLV